jgi:predicted DNA-binding transcriptional regulator YafY
MRRAERFLQLLQILRRHRAPVTGEVIADELQVSLRTVYRDIASLIGERVPIRGEAGVGYVLEDGFDMPPLMFTVDELEAVMLGLRWVSRRGDGQLSRAAKDAVAKIGAVLPNELKPFLFDASLIVPPRSWIATDAVDVAGLRESIRKGRKVEIRYHNEAGEVTKRVIWPLGVAYFEATRNVIAWCELREGFRYFRTDRIEEIAYLDQRYPGRRKALLKSWQEQIRVESAMPDWDVFS